MIRFANRSDMRHIYEIGLSLFEKPYSLLQFEQEFFLSQSIILISHDDNTITGYLIGRIILDTSEIIQIGVKKEFQQKGFGHILLQTFFDESIKRQCSSIFLEVSTENHSAIQLYEKCGFSRLHIRRQYYHSGQSALMMKKIL